MLFLFQISINLKSQDWLNKYDNFSEITSIDKSKYFKVSLNGKFGLVDNKGNLIIPVQYDRLSFIDKYIISVSNTPQKINYLFSKTGKELIKSSDNEFSFIEYPGPKYRNDEYKPIIWNNTYYIKSFNKQNGKEGLILLSNDTAREVIPPIFNSIKASPPQLFYVYSQESGIRLHGFFDMNGKKIFVSDKYDYLCCGNTYPRYLVVGRTNKKYYIIDENGNELSKGYSKIDEDQFVYDLNYEFSKYKIDSFLKKPDNKIIVADTLIDVGKMKQIIIDANGKEISKVYDRVEPGYNESYWIIVQANKMGLYATGMKKEVLEPNFDLIGPRNKSASSDFCIIKLKEKFGLFLFKTHTYIEAIYDDLNEYPKRVKLNGVWGKINNGKFVPF